jgi:hypothetical protein
LQKSCLTAQAGRRDNLSRAAGNLLIFVRASHSD